MKIKSIYLDREFEVKTNETTLDDGTTTTSLSHESLENLINNECSDMGIKYDMSVEKADRDHSIVKCTITDSKGRRIVAIGEAVPETLYTPVSKNIPVTMTSIRAFDRAAIRYLDFPGKFYSTEELGGSNASDAKGKPSAPEKKTAKAATAAPKNGGVSVTPAENDPDELPLEKATEAAEEASAPAEKSFGETPITFGIHKGKTPDELSKTEKGIGWLHYMADIKNPYGDKKIFVQQVQQYIAERGL